MASRKQRRAAAAARAARSAPVAQAPVQPAVRELEVRTAARQRGRPAGRPPDDEPRWSRVGLLVLLLLTFAAQLVVGAVTHLLGHRQRLLVVDLVFFQAPFLMAGSVLLAPLAKYLTHQPRRLRLLESVSLGALFAVLALLLLSVFVHPAVSAKATQEQLIDHLTLRDAMGIVLADVLAMLGTVQLFPGLQRVVTAPGRRAQRRLLERRTAAGQRPSKSSAKPTSSAETRSKR